MTDEWAYTFCTNPTISLEKSTDYTAGIQYTVRYWVDLSNNHHSGFADCLDSAIQYLFYNCNIKDPINDLLNCDKLSLEETLQLLKIKKELSA